MQTSVAIGAEFIYFFAAKVKTPKTFERILADMWEPVATKSR